MLAFGVRLLFVGALAFEPGASFQLSVLAQVNPDDTLAELGTGDGLVAGSSVCLLQMGFTPQATEIDSLKVVDDDPASAIHSFAKHPIAQSTQVLPSLGGDTRVAQLEVGADAELAARTVLTHREASNGTSLAKSTGVAATGASNHTSHLVVDASAGLAAGPAVKLGSTIPAVVAAGAAAAWIQPGNVAPATTSSGRMEAAHLREYCTRRVVVLGLMFGFLCCAVASHLVAKKPSKKIWHESTCYLTRAGQGPLRVRACTWNFAGVSDDDLQTALTDPQIFDEWLVSRAPGEDPADIIAICVQGVDQENITDLRRLIHIKLGKEYKLAARPEDSKAESAGLATMIFTSRQGLPQDELLGKNASSFPSKSVRSRTRGPEDQHGLALGFVNVHLPSRKPSRSRSRQHYLSELLNDLGHLDNLDVAMVLGDHSSESMAQPQQGARVELDADVRLFGFEEAYSPNDISGRDRVIYKTLGGLVVKTMEYKLCSFSKDEGTGTLSRGGRRPVVQTLTVG